MINAVRQSPKIRLSIFFVLVFTIIVGGIYWWHRGQAPQQSQVIMPAHSQSGIDRSIPVQAATAIKQSVPHYLTGLGTIVAASTVTVRSRVEGYLMAIHFNEGDEVQAGELLAEIDPRPYKVALTQVQGQLLKDRAILKNARLDLKRYENLAKRNLVSDQMLDNQRATIAETLGTIKADEADVAKAQLDLAYSRIKAPISGRIGLRQVDPGNYISSSDSKGIVVITQTHPVDMIFSLPESTIFSILAARKNGQTIEVEAWDRSNQTLLSRGTLQSIDNQIDTATGTIKMKARFSNRDDKLFPNQFVNARLRLNVLEDAIVIPPSGLQMGNDGNFVWVVDNQNRVSKKQVTTGIRGNKVVVITSGLDAGERVVTDGIDRLTEGAKVNIISAQVVTADPLRDIGAHP